MLLSSKQSFLVTEFPFFNFENSFYNIEKDIGRAMIIKHPFAYGCLLCNFQGSGVLIKWFNWVLGERAVKEEI